MAGGLGHQPEEACPRDHPAIAKGRPVSITNVMTPVAAVQLCQSTGSAANLMGDEDDRRSVGAGFDEKVAKGQGSGLALSGLAEEGNEGGEWRDRAQRQKASGLQAAAPAAGIDVSVTEPSLAKRRADGAGLVAPPCVEIALGSAVPEHEALGISDARGQSVAERDDRAGLVEAADFSVGNAVAGKGQGGGEDGSTGEYDRYVTRWPTGSGGRSTVVPAASRLPAPVSRRQR